MPSPKSTTDWEARSLRLVFTALTAVAVVFLIGPSLIVILTSLTASQSLRFPPNGLSFRWYLALLDADQMQQAAWTSLVAAFWTTLLSAVLGTAAALAIARSGSAGSFLAFMASFDNVPVSLFLADERTEVLPIHLWQQIETNLDVRTAAVSGVIVVLTLLLMLLAERFAGLTRQMR